MDFKKYYELQAAQNFPIYRGNRYMRGYGFGSVFKRFFRWILPIVKENALPVAKNIGKEAIKSAINIANDTIDGKTFSESAKSNMKKSLNSLSEQYGRGKKRKISGSFLKKSKKIKFQNGNGKNNILSSKVKKKQIDKISKLRKKNLKSNIKRSLDIFD